MPRPHSITVLEYSDPSHFLSDLDAVLAKYLPSRTDAERAARTKEILDDAFRLNREGEHRLQEKLARCARRPFSRLVDRPLASRVAA